MLKGRPFVRLAVLAAILIPLAVVAMSATSWWEGGHTPSSLARAPMVVTVASTTPQPWNAATLQKGFSAILKPAISAVVNVSSSKLVRNQDNGGLAPFFDDPFFRQFFGNQFNIPKERREQSLGSGVIVSPDGYILTNYHVVDHSTDVKVYLSDKREMKARVVGTDAKTDIAVLKIEGTGYHTLTLGDSSKEEVGDLVFAIGNPFGLGQTVTMGIVSATGRANLGIEDYEDFIQTDAAINPGNSGGALINAEGQLIGINTAILSQGGGNQGVGFAIPINLARQVMEQIMEHGKVVRGWVGLSIQEVTPEIAKAFGLSEPHGALVGDVTAGSPASAAGLAPGDIILEMNGQSISDTQSFRLKVAQTAPGTTVHLRVLRKGKELDIPVTLKEMPADLNEKASSEAGEKSVMEGVVVDELTPQIRQQLNLPSNTEGVVILRVADGTPAGDAGLKRGDVIQEVNHKPVNSVPEFESAVRAAGNGSVLLLINRAGTTLFVVVEAE
jgi:serine protease Do